MPSLQVLQRTPIRRAIPGSIEQQEFEYVRHGTVNLLLFLAVHTGRMEAACVATKIAAHYVEQLRAFRRRHRGLKGLFLIQDGDPSHRAQLTADYLQEHRAWWRPRQTPVHGSWLNQAELLNHTFRRRCLQRASWPEYNARYAHPFEWTWTNAKLRKWLAEHAN